MRSTETKNNNTKNKGNRTNKRSEKMWFGILVKRYNLIREELLAMPCALTFHSWKKANFTLAVSLISLYSSSKSSVRDVCRQYNPRGHESRYSQSKDNRGLVNVWYWVRKASPFANFPAAASVLRSAVLLHWRFRHIIKTTGGKI